MLAVGIWVAADKTSFIKLTLNVTHLTNTTDGENSDELLKVSSQYMIYVSLPNLLFLHN